VTILGENYVQEAREKIEEIGHGVQWHMIGHLQKNKAKYAVTLFDYIHSLDGIPLAQEIDRRASQKGVRVRALVEVNLSGEASKFGIDSEAVMDLIYHVAPMKHISIEGLMTILHGNVGGLRGGYRGGGDDGPGGDGDLWGEEILRGGTGVRLKSQVWKRKMLLLPFFMSLFLLWVGCGRKGPPVSLDRIVPKVVTDLEASVREEQVILQWSLPKENTDGSRLVDLQGFRVLRESFEGEECKGCPERLVPIAEGDLASGEHFVMKADRAFWFDEGLRAGRTYRYRVLAFNRRGHFSQVSNKVEVLWDTPPPPPKQLLAVAGDGMVELKWTPVEEAVGYNLYRGEPERDFPLHPLKPEPIEDTNYRDIRVVNDRDYRYTVRSVSKAGETLVEGSSSTAITVTPIDLIPPSPPTGLVAFPLPAGMELSWAANPEPDVVGYRVYRRRVFEEGFKRLTDEMVRGIIYVDKEVKRGEEYDYGVTAIDASRHQNESAFSEMIRVKYTYIE
jgi:hypothetical protein